MGIGGDCVGVGAVGEVEGGFWQATCALLKRSLGGLSNFCLKNSNIILYFRNLENEIAESDRKLRLEKRSVT